MTWCASTQAARDLFLCRDRPPDLNLSWTYWHAQGAVDPGEWRPVEGAGGQRRRVKVRRRGEEPEPSPAPAAVDTSVPAPAAPAPAAAASSNPFAGISLTAPAAPANPFAGISLLAPASKPGAEVGCASCCAMGRGALCWARPGQTRARCCQALQPSRVSGVCAEGSWEWAWQLPCHRGRSVA